MVAPPTRKFLTKQKCRDDDVCICVTQKKKKIVFFFLGETTHIVSVQELTQKNG